MDIDFKILLPLWTLIFASSKDIIYKFFFFFACNAAYKFEKIYKWSQAHVNAE